MHRLWATGAAALVCLAIGGLPVLAQEPTSTVSFDDVAFSFDRALGASANVTQVRGQGSDVEQPNGADVPHLAFTLYGARAEGAKAPRVGVSPGVVRFYRTADLAGDDQASQQLEDLTTLLSERPDLAAFMDVADDGSGEPLPFLPVIPAAQVIRAQAQYVETPQVAGIAYLAAYRQDVSPFAAGDFWYTFQGISADGAWYVAVDVVVDASMFPAEITAKDAARVADGEQYSQYLAESIETLNGASADAFDPPLTSIDALVQSITFEGVAANE
jgi:hypothetical protein